MAVVELRLRYSKHSLSYLFCRSRVIGLTVGSEVSVKFWTRRSTGFEILAAQGPELLHWALKIPILPDVDLARI
jgi:hypothetical protein